MKSTHRELRRRFKVVNNVCMPSTTPKRGKGSADRLLQSLAEINMKPAELARELGETDQTISNWKARGRISAGRNTAVAGVVGLCPDWLWDEIGPQWCEPRRKRAGADKYLDDQGEAIGPPSIDASGNVVPFSGNVGSTYSVPLFNARGSMGPGGIRPDQEVVVRRIEVDTHFARRMTSSPANLQMLTAYGDSMSPMLNDGDVLLVDTSVTVPRIDAIYVIGRGPDEVMIKRVNRMLDGSVELVSENKSVRTMVIPKEEVETLEVLGRVVYAWNGRKL